MSDDELSPGGDTVAAVDLGSNSFHMIVARPGNGGFVVVDRLREMVQMAAGLDEQRHLSPEAAERALDCLGRFGQRLRHMPQGTVRIVGTNTLRSTRDAGAFLDAAEKALGHPIEVISGVEEARLVYEGVAHSLANDGRRRLVMDIGGGSTELIIGERFQPLHMESMYVGCVSVSRAYFADGAIDRKAIRRAELAALVELEPHQAIFRDMGWEEAVGASGTIRAVARVVSDAGWGKEGITLDALKQLVDMLLKKGHVDKLRLPGLSAHRASVFPGGVAVLLAAFEALGIETMKVSSGALREGLLYDLLGRIRHEDVRERTVGSLAERYHVDLAQAARVEETALRCLEQVEGTWSFEPAPAEQLLRWASRLHEIGLGIAHSQYHKHGAYILEHADLPGFSQQEQHLLALLVRAHRRKFPDPLFKGLSAAWEEAMRRTAVLLRLAVVLRRSRSPMALPDLVLRAGERSLAVRFPGGWLEDHPLTQIDLGQEAAFLKAAGFELSWS